MAYFIHAARAWLAALALLAAGPVLAIPPDNAFFLPPETSEKNTPPPANSPAEHTFHHLLQLSMEGSESEALRGLDQFIERPDVSPPLRIRAYALAIAIASELEDWPHAFSLLGSAMEELPDAPEEISRLLTAASHLHTLAEESERAIDLGMRAVQAAEIHNNTDHLCQALAALARAHERADDLASALEWRQYQLQTCSMINKEVFIANAQYGIGKVLAAQGNHHDALTWAEQALASFQALNYANGMHDARKVIVASLIALEQSPERIQQLLEDISSHAQSHFLAQDMAEIEQIRAAHAEKNGDTAASTTHLQNAIAFGKEARRLSRTRQLAYLNAEFDSRFKEQYFSLQNANRALAEAHSRAKTAQIYQIILSIGTIATLLLALILILQLLRTRKESRQYRTESEYDELTGLLNRKQLYQQGSEALAKALKEGQPITAVALDIDLFKQVNDNYGHAAGDATLRALGGWILGTLRNQDIAARRGGDEFVLLLHTDASQTERALRRLHGQIRPIDSGEHLFNFTISVGICQADADTTSLEQLLHQADLALYRAKKQGRNRMVQWHDKEPDTSLPHGSLVVVGSGIQFARHVNERTLSEIQQAQVLFCLTDAFALAMIQKLRPDAIDLRSLCAQERNWNETFHAIEVAVMEKVRAGNAVCVVFHGHPSLFPDLPQRLIRKTRAEGLKARMEPGISAEACLYADLGIALDERSVQSLEVTHFLSFEHRIETNGLVLLWQPGLVGDLATRQLHTGHRDLQVLMEKLLRWYPPDHEVIIYTPADLPIYDFQTQAIRLRELPEATFQAYSSLVIPPLGELKSDPRVNRVGIGNREGHREAASSASSAVP